MVSLVDSKVFIGTSIFYTITYVSVKSRHFFKSPSEQKSVAFLFANGTLGSDFYGSFANFREQMDLRQDTFVMSHPFRR